MRDVYLDHYAANPVLPEVLDAMLPFFSEDFGNPSSLHGKGDAARQAVEEARGQVAALINAAGEELIFTASGTESNNLAIKGIAGAAKRRGNHIVVSAIEHFSVLNSVATLEKAGFASTLVDVDEHGLIDPAAVRQAITDETVLISVMAANGEIGTIEPIKEVAAIARERGIPIHTDAVAAAGSIPLDVTDLGVDALSLASDMLYGPKGSAALWVRDGLRIVPRLDGGVQEGGRRGGTENVPAMVGMGKAAEIAASRMRVRSERLTSLRDALIEGLPRMVPHVTVTGHPSRRLPWNASFAVRFVEGEGMLLFLDSSGIAVSSGSACTSRALKGSHVLTACGIPAERAQGSLLFSFGLENEPEDVDYILGVLPPIIDRLRKMSPLYDKFIKEGGGGNGDI